MSEALSAHHLFIAVRATSFVEETSPTCIIFSAHGRMYDSYGRAWESIATKVEMSVE